MSERGGERSSVQSSILPPKSAPTINSEADAETQTEAGFVWESDKGDLATLLANWMGTSLVQSTRIWDVTMPGTHNSATYQVTHKESNRAFMKFASLFIKCQEKSVSEQLYSGIRFLDLRTGKHPNVRATPFCAHGGYRTAPLLDVYRDIAAFLRSHPSEIVILSVRRDAGFRRGPTALSLLESDFWVSLYLGEFLGPKLRSGTTVGALIARRQQLLYFYSEIERYLPSENEMFASRFDTHKSEDFDRLDSVLSATALPKQLKIPDEFNRPDNRVNFPGRLNFVASPSASPLSGSPRVTHSSKPSVSPEPLSPVPSLLGTGRSQDNLLVMHRLEEAKRVNDRQTTSSRSSRQNKKQKVSEATLKMEETRFLSRCLEECVPHLEDLGNSNLRKEISEHLADSRGSDFFEIRWRGGLIQYSPSPGTEASAPQMTRSTSNSVGESQTSFEMLQRSAPHPIKVPADVQAMPERKLPDRFSSMPESQSIRLGHVDAQRFRAIGLSKEFFLYPLKGFVGSDFMFASPLMTGRTLIEKSWAQTCENNPQLLMQKLKYWTAMHGRKMPRPPYRFRILAAEVTPPSLDFPQPGSETMKFWATQSAATLLFLPSGLKPNAEQANRLLVTDCLTREIVCRLNVITHDFASTRIILTMIFRHLKILAEANQIHKPLPVPQPQRLPRVETHTQEEDARRDLGVSLEDLAKQVSRTTSETQEANGDTARRAPLDPNTS